MYRWYGAVICGTVKHKFQFVSVVLSENKLTNTSIASVNAGYTKYRDRNNFTVMKYTGIFQTKGTTHA